MSTLRPYTYFLSALFVLPAALAVSACTYPKVFGDAPDENDSVATGIIDDTAEPTTEGSPLVCANPAFTCSGPVDCEQWAAHGSCGPVTSQFDAAGCLRPSCADSPCAADELCYLYNADEPIHCAVDLLACADQGDSCACEVSDACSTQYCIPADEGPPAECPALTDEGACLAAGCDWHEQEAFWSKTGVGGTAECLVEEVKPFCTFLPGHNIAPILQEAPLYEKATGRAVLFPLDRELVPHGWGRCGDPDAPSSCDCITVCADKQEAAAAFLDQDKPCDDVSDCALAEAICFNADTCGNVGVHKDNLAAWDALHAELGELGCCDGAAACGAGVACVDNRCVAAFPPE